MSGARARRGEGEARRGRGEGDQGTPGATWRAYHSTRNAQLTELGDQILEAVAGAHQLLLVAIAITGDVGGDLVDYPRWCGCAGGAVAM